MRKTLVERMKQQDAYKLLAAFMILIMIIVPAAYVVTSPRSNTELQTSAQQSQQDKYNPEFWVVNSPFDSISEALKITPAGTVTAFYADIEGMTPQMVQWTKTRLPVDDMDTLYKSNTTKLYYALLPSFQQGAPNFLVLSAMLPEKNDFEYMVLPDTYPPILRRQDTGAINIMGNPVIYTNDKTARDVLDILFSQNKTATGYDRYEGLLSKVEPVQFQIVNSTVSFANQFYMGIGMTNGTYERTTAYFNINSSNLTRLNQLKTNSTQRGFVQYNITRSGNYTIVKIASHDLFNVLNEETS